MQRVRIISTIKKDVVAAADETLRRAGLTRAQAVRMMFVRLACGNVPESAVFEGSKSDDVCNVAR